MIQTALLWSWFWFDVGMIGFYAAMAFFGLIAVSMPFRNEAMKTLRMVLLMCAMSAFLVSLIGFGSTTSLTF
jgi:preprotein translocase subunit SecE